MELLRKMDFPEYKVTMVMPRFYKLISDGESFLFATVWWIGRVGLVFVIDLLYWQILPDGELVGSLLLPFVSLEFWSLVQRSEPVKNISACVMDDP